MAPAGWQKRSWGAATLSPVASAGESARLRSRQRRGIGCYERRRERVTDCQAITIREFLAGEREHDVQPPAGRQARAEPELDRRRPAGSTSASRNAANAGAPECRFRHVRHALKRRP